MIERIVCDMLTAAAGLLDEGGVEEGCLKIVSTAQIDSTLMLTFYLTMDSKSEMHII